MNVPIEQNARRWVKYVIIYFRTKFLHLCPNFLNKLLVYPTETCFSFTGKIIVKVNSPFPQNMASVYLFNQ